VYFEHSIGLRTLNEGEIKMELEKKKDDNILEGEESEAFKLESEKESSSDLDWEPKFDEDGNLIEDDDSKDSDEPYKDDFTPEDEPEEQPIKEKKALPPAESKIINLKKELAAKEKRIKELEEAKQQEETEQQKADIVKGFVAKGYDEKSAKAMTETELRLKQLEESQTELLFLKNNTELLKKYPSAKDNVLDIVKKSKLTGMTAEQICRGLYGGSAIPEHEKRATKAVSGEIETIDDVEDISNDSRTIQSDSETTMTTSERNYIRLMESRFGKMTKEEIKRALKK